METFKNNMESYVAFNVPLEVTTTLPSEDGIYFVLFPQGTKFVIEVDMQKFKENEEPKYRTIKASIISDWRNLSHYNDVGAVFHRMS